MKSLILCLAMTAVITMSGVVIGSDENATTQQASAEKREASALEHDVVELLSNVDPKSTLQMLQEALAPQLAAVVETHFVKLKAGADPTVIESTDGRFVVVVIGDAAEGMNGKDVRAKSDAELLLVVGGRAGARSAGGECYGGTGHAEATRGIGIGLGGIGGRGTGDGVGSGGGGGAGATGIIGAIALGGSGGQPGDHGGRGSSGSGVEPMNLAGIIKDAKSWNDVR